MVFYECPKLPQPNPKIPSYPCSWTPRVLGNLSQTNLQKPGKIHRVSESWKRFPHDRDLFPPITIPNFMFHSLTPWIQQKTLQNLKSPWKSPTKTISGKECPPYTRAVFCVAITSIWANCSTSLFKGSLCNHNLGIPFLNLNKGHFVEIPQYNSLNPPTRYVPTSCIRGGIPTYKSIIKTPGKPFKAMGYLGISPHS